MSAPIPTTDVTLPSRIERRCLIALLALAALLRFGVICWKPESLAEDRDLYWGIANRMAAGEGYVHPDLGHPTAYRPPLYPLMLSVIVWSGGGSLNLGALQFVLSLATVGLTMNLGRRLGSGRFGLLAAGFVALNPLLIQSTTLAMTETLCTLLVTMAFVCVSLERARPTNQRWLIGVLWGMSVLCRPTVWLYVVLASAVSVACWWKPKSNGPRRPFVEVMRCWLPIAIVFGLTVLPWTIRNLVVFGTPIITTTHGGYTFFLGNNDEAYRAEIMKPAGVPWDSRAWQESLEDELQRAGIAQADEVARDRWMSQQARDWIRQHPREFAESCWLHVRRFWNIFPGGADAGSLPKVAQWGMAAFFAIELLAAAVGLWRLRRDEWLRWWPLVLLVLSFALVHVAYWSNLRMRAPVEPVLALLAARGLVSANSEKS